jgi:hypothetical protein
VKQSLIIGGDIRDRGRRDHCSSFAPVDDRQLDTGRRNKGSGIPLVRNVHDFAALDPVPAVPLDPRPLTLPENRLLRLILMDDVLTLSVVPADRPHRLRQDGFDRPVT